MMARDTSVCACFRHCISTLALALCVCNLSGCYNWRTGFTHFPPGAMNQPTGTFTRQWQSAQADKVAHQGLVLWRASWIGESDRLGPAAQDRLQQLCQPNCTVPAMITLETSHDAALDERRKQAIMQLASARGTMLEPELIVVAAPDANVLYSEEAMSVSSEMMQGNRKRSSAIVLPYGAAGMMGFDQLGGLVAPVGIGR